ncbi:epsin-2-like isoform X2 [Clavelina lepadiformis]|uniref:epsin-2-like isoform X2 n=1 Tax=Clavelina lepadiformis TaxID=159417 RepID=UPI00404303A8
MALSVRRNVLNVVRNYSDAEIKVREATSNDPWGPSSSLMSEIADMTYNVVYFSEIMTMIWKRINDHGKNWRHVYKALVLLDYLIKTGSERVAQQCKENIFAIQTLKDFQFIDRDVKDQGSNVREKSKQLVNLLKDDERLKTERARALKAKERFAQTTTGIGSDHKVVYGHGSTTPQQRTPEIPSSRTTATTSSVSHEIEQQVDSDKIRLEMAISESAKKAPPQQETESKQKLVDLSAAAKTLKSPWGESEHAPSASHSAQVDPFAALTGQEQVNDPWTTPSTSALQPVSTDPWPLSGVSSADPWSIPPTTFNDSSAHPNVDLFKSTGNVSTNNTTAAPDPFSSLSASSAQEPFDMIAMNNALSIDQSFPSNSKANPSKKAAEDFLGGASDLVNLDNLVTRPSTQQQGANPFLSSSSPYHQPTQNPMTLNQMKGIGTPAGPASGTTIMAQPTLPMMPLNAMPMMNTYGMQTTQASVQPIQPFGMPALQSQGASMGQPQPFITGGASTQTNKNPFL